MLREFTSEIEALSGDITSVDISLLKTQEGRWVGEAKCLTEGGVEVKVAVLAGCITQESAEHILLHRMIEKLFG